MSRRKPVIGVSSNFVLNDKPELKGLGYDFHQAFDCYVRVIAQAGALPIVIPCQNEPEARMAYLDLIDGIFFIGGKDYPPEYYGQTPLPETSLMTRERYESDWGLATAAVKETRLPILGVCAGAQLLNIVFGGQILQHIVSDIKHLGWATHPARQTGRGLLASIIAEREFTVNSSHHQAVLPEKVGAGLRIAALAPDGIVEAVEYEGDRFILGTQWHPERMNDSTAARIFGTFIEAAGKGRHS